MVFAGFGKLTAIAFVVPHDDGHKDADGRADAGPTRIKVQPGPADFLMYQTDRSNCPLWLRAAAAALCGAMLVALPRSSEADEPAEQTRDARQVATLVAQLGSEDFALRELASEELARIGLPALSALEAAATHPDREVRYRSIRVLGTIRELDLQRRLDVFLSGKEDASEYPLPAWSRFKKAYGDEAASRQLFVEMTRADAQVLQALEDGPKNAGDLLAQRAIAYQQAMQVGGVQQLSLGQAAAMLLVGGQEDVTLPVQTMNMVLNYGYQQSIRATLTDGSKGTIPRKMLGAIIRRCEDANAYQAMNIAINLGLDEGMTPALRILKGEGVRAAHFSQYALMTVAKFGDQSHVPLVEKLLDDNSVASRMQENSTTHEIQVRDSALATVIILTKQDLKAYFTERPNVSNPDVQQIFFNPKVIGFTDEEKRAATHKKWAEYKAKQPQPDGAPPAPKNDAPAAEPDK